MVYISRLSPKFLSKYPSYRSTMSNVSKTRKYWTPEEDNILRQEALSQCISTPPRSVISDTRADQWARRAHLQ
jgi:hypothetical protein